MKKYRSQAPTKSVILDYRKTLGNEAIELYKKRGRNPFPWREKIIKSLFAINNDGLWTHSKFGYSVPRRNGKNEILVMREVYGLMDGEAINHTTNGVDKDGLRLFEKINGYLENRYKPADEKEEEIILRNIANIESSLLKNKLNHDIIVYRNDANPGELEGEVKKFLSTSVTKKGVIKGKPNFAIIIPKGSNGSYIEMLAKGKFKKQREFLVNSNSKIKKLYSNKDFIIYKLG